MSTISKIITLIVLFFTFIFLELKFTLSYSSLNFEEKAFNDYYNYISSDEKNKEIYNEMCTIECYINVVGYK